MRLQSIVDTLFNSIMTCSAQCLVVGRVPEQGLHTTVWGDVVYHGSGHLLTRSCMQHAVGVRCQVPRAVRLPLRTVPTLGCALPGHAALPSMPTLPHCGAHRPHGLVGSKGCAPL